jgi:hypothetical protein
MATKLISKNKEGGKKDWIKGAVDPKHEGYCTPMTKDTCTPKRKAFAMTMKKHHGFHKDDGGTMPMAQHGMAITPNNGFIRGWFNAEPPRGISRENTTGYGDKDYYPKLQARNSQQLRKEHTINNISTAAKLGSTAAIIGGAGAVGTLPAMALGAGRLASVPFTGAFATAGGIGGKWIMEGLGKIGKNLQSRKPLPLDYSIQNRSKPQ